MLVFLAFNVESGLDLIQFKKGAGLALCLCWQSSISDIKSPKNNNINAKFKLYFGGFTGPDILLYAKAS